MKWITRKNVKVDRVACPWLIRRFVDPAAEFLFVDEEELLQVAQADQECSALFAGQQFIDVVLLLVGLLGQGEVISSRPCHTRLVCCCTDSIEPKCVRVFEQVENLSGHIKNERPLTMGGIHQIRNRTGPYAVAAIPAFRLSCRDLH